MFRAQQKRVVTPGQNASIIWQAFSQQQRKGTLRQRDQNSSLFICHAGKSCATTDEPKPSR